MTSSLCLAVSSATGKGSSGIEGICVEPTGEGTTFSDAERCRVLPGQRGSAIQSRQRVGTKVDRAKNLVEEVGHRRISSAHALNEAATTQMLAWQSGRIRTMIGYPALMRERRYETQASSVDILA